MAAEAAPAAFKKILVLGFSNSGKSTLINALVNNSTVADKLTHPAPVGGSISSCTEQIQLYFSANRTILFDTPGFCDSREGPDRAMAELKKYVFLEDVPIHGILFLVPNTTLSQDARQQFELVKRLFKEEDFFRKARLLITKSDTESSWEAFKAKNNADPLMPQMERFTSHVLGSLEVRKDFPKEIEEAYLGPKRTKFLNEVKQLVDSFSIDDPVKMTGNWFQEIVLWFKSIFRTVTDKKMIEKYARAERKIYQVGYCGICLEDVLNDRHRLSCHHEFHFDCLAVWAQKSATCPFCRRHIPQMVAPEVVDEMLEPEGGENAADEQKDDAKKEPPKTPTTSETSVTPSEPPTASETSVAPSEPAT